MPREATGGEIVDSKISGIFWAPTSSLATVAMATNSPAFLSRNSFISGFPLDNLSLSPLKRRRKSNRLVEASWQEVAGVLVFSAIPFTVVKAIANSPLGSALQNRMQATKMAAIKNLPKTKESAERARRDSFWYGEERPRWLGPLSYKYPAYLTGEFPGDYGFDIAGLSEDPVAFQKYFNFEILHCRWAMLAALGVLIPELLDHFDVVHFAEPVWWKVGYAKLKVGPEYARYCGIEALEPLGIYLPGDINYPGGILFDPLGLSKNPTDFEDLKVKEMKNGRLAMVAWLGFYLQAAVTGKGPIQNLSDHLSDPLHNNLFSLLRS